MTDEITHTDNLNEMIHIIRGKQVILYHDLAALYQVQNKRFIEQVTQKKISDAFMFQLTEEEFKILKSENVSNAPYLKRKRPPYAFTEKGVNILSNTIKTNNAIKIGKQIKDMFINRFITLDEYILIRLDYLDMKILEQDLKFDKILRKIKSKEYQIGKSFKALCNNKNCRSP